MEQTDEPRPVRRRRRAVGPPGAAPAEPVGSWGQDEPAALPAPDDDDRLRADVPPHHGGH